MESPGGGCLALSHLVGSQGKAPYCQRTHWLQNPSQCLPQPRVSSWESWEWRPDWGLLTAIRFLVLFYFPTYPLLHPKVSTPPGRLLCSLATGHEGSLYVPHSQPLLKTKPFQMTLSWREPFLSEGLEHPACLSPGTPHICLVAQLCVHSPLPPFTML